MLLLALAILILLGWFSLLRTLSQSPSIAEHLLLTLLFSLAQIIGLSIVLGFLGCLNQASIIIANTTLGLTSAGLGIRRRNGPDGLSLRLSRPGLTMLTLVSGLLLVLLLLLIAVVLLKGAFLGPVSVDGRWYHLPAAFIYAQTGSFQAVGNLIIDSYPRNGEVWFHWLYVLLGSEQFLDIGQLPFLALYLVSVYVLAERLQISSSQRPFVALLSCFAPIVFSQLTTAHIDFILASFLIAAVACLFAFIQSGQKLFFFAGSTALGILIGTKGAALGSGALLTAAYCLSAAIKMRSITSKVTAIALCILLVGLLGSTSYLQNMLLHGNPFYPYEMTIAGLSFSGPLDPTETLWPLKKTAPLGYGQRILSSWIRVGEAGYGYTLGGFGVTWPYMLAAIGISFCSALANRRYAWCWMYCLFGAMFFVTPLNFSPRFSLFLLVPGALAAGSILTNWPSRSILSSTVLSMAAIAALVTTAQALTTARFYTTKTGTSHARTCVNAGDPKSYRGAYRWIQENVEAQRTLVAVTGETPYSIYCLWNADLSNRVGFQDLRSAEEIEPYFRDNPLKLLFVPRERISVYPDKLRSFIRYQDDWVTILGPNTVGYQ